MGSNKDMVAAMEAKLDKAKVYFQFEFLDRWNRRTPAVTGTLRAGNTVNVTDTAFEFINDVHYFPFVENGTEYQHPVGMLKTTVAESADIWAVAARRAKL